MTSYRGLVATGTTQGTALLLASDGAYFEVVNSYAGATGVRLAVFAPGSACMINNVDTDTAVLIYPPTGGTVGGGATNAGYSLAMGSSVELLTADGTNWRVAPARSSLENVITCSDSLVLTTSQSGSTVYATPGTGYVINLPAPAMGANFRIVKRTTATGTITVTSTGANVYGLVMGDVTAVACAGVTNVIFHTTNSIRGDYVSLRSDGIVWFVEARGATTAAFSVS